MFSFTNVHNTGEWWEAGPEPRF